MGSPSCGGLNPLAYPLIGAGNSAMSREQFSVTKFHASTRAVIEQANAIIEEYQAQGFALTLRQLFYQFVARDLIENTIKDYKRLGSIIRNARDAGMVDWSAIEDRTREVNTHTSWESPAKIINAVANQYQENLWEDQKHRPEVWVEKDALIGVIEGVCTEYRVPYFAHRGNNSQTLQYQAGKRFADYLDQGLIPLVLHLADHDPNGIDMTRDNIERLKLYAGAEVELRRIALNMDQVKQYRPPPSFAKEADTRFAAYVEKFGNECWELDALSPAVIADLIRTELDGMIDLKPWKRRQVKETRGRTLLSKVAGNWAKVEKLVSR
jgi:hypothetical protein